MSREESLRRAEQMPISYAVRHLRAPDGRALVVLGEAHLKLARAAAVGREVVSEFALRGVETFPVDRVLAGRALYVLVHLPRLLLRAVSLGLVKGSTITEAKALTHGRTVEIEAGAEIPLGLHVGSLYLSALFTVFFAQVALTIVRAQAPIVTLLGVAFQAHMILLIPALLLRRARWSWLLHPAVTILTARDRIMADGAAAMMRRYPDDDAVVVLGRAHVPGLTRELIERHGFTASP